MTTDLETLNQKSALHLAHDALKQAEAASDKPQDATLDGNITTALSAVAACRSRMATLGA